MQAYVHNVALEYTNLHLSQPEVLSLSLGADTFYLDSVLLSKQNP
jgi:hypothetical protein